MSSLQTVLEEKCEVLLRERGVLFAGLISKSGKLVSGGFKSGIKIVDESEKEILFMEHVLMATMNNDFDNCFGRVLYTISKREKMTIINFSIDSSLFLIAVDPIDDTKKETSKIQQIIKNFATRM